MDAQTVIAAVSIAGSGLGGYVSGHLTGRTSASQIASGTLEMLQSQVNLLKEDRDAKQAELDELRTRICVLEELVTQRAEVEELGNKISLVKDTVDRIAIRVGA